MNTQEKAEKKKYLLNMDIDESYEFTKGFGVKHLGHFMVLFIPLGLLVWVMLTPIQSEVVRMFVRMFGEGVGVVLVFLLVKLRRFQHCTMTYISILSERVAFAIRRRNNKNKSFFDKGV